MESGIAFGSSIYGYLIKNGKLTVNEDEAKYVRLIFDLYLNEGMGTYLLCKELENRGIPSPSGSPVWKNPSILRMLRNEKYIGTLKQKKEITVDYLSHRRKTNEGEEEYIIIENNHEAIIDRDVWEKVQTEIVRRRTVAIDKSKHSNRYVWSGKIECELCGSKFKRRINSSKRKGDTIAWQCHRAIKDGRKKINNAGLEIGCDCQSIHEAILQEQFLEVLKQIATNKEEIKNQIKTVLMDVISNSNDYADDINRIETEIQKLTNRKLKLVDLFTDGAITRREFDVSNDNYIKQTEILTDELNRIKQQEAIGRSIEDKLSIVNSAVDSIFDFEELSDEICKQLLAKVTVKGRDSISFYISDDSGCDFFSPLSIRQSGLPYRKRPKSANPYADRFRRLYIVGCV